MVVIKIKSVNIYKTLTLVPGFVLNDREDIRGGKGERERKEEQGEGGRKERNVPLKIPCARKSPFSCWC